MMVTVNNSLAACSAGHLISNEAIFKSLLFFQGLNHLFSAKSLPYVSFDQWQ